MVEKMVLKNGVRIVSEHLPHLRSCAIGIWVESGSRHEPEELCGISHFIEHMMFKGTAKRTARQIASDADALGAQINAFTSKESTCYYIKSLTSNVDKACEIIIDMLTGSLFDPEEMAKEKQVVKEEIKMVEDTPEDDVQDMLYEVLFKGDPLSNSILGTPESLDRITQDDIRNYIARDYTLDNIVVSVAGNFDVEQVCAQFENSLSCMTASKEEKKTESGIYLPSFRTKVKDIEQSHICLGTRALSFGHEDVYALTVLNNIMGGSMSSRLFQNIREEKGMAYTVYSYTSAYNKNGLYAINAGVAHDKIEDTVYAIREELEKLAADGVTDDELRISKEQTKGSYIFSLENTGSRMVSNGKHVINCNTVKNPEDVIRAVDSVTHDDIRRVASLITDIGTYSGSLVSKRDVDLAALLK